MPLYNFRGPSGKDNVSVDLKDDNRAWTEAIRSCGDLLREEEGRLSGGAPWSVEVTEGDRIVASINLTAHRH